MKRLTEFQLLTDNQLIELIEKNTLKKIGDIYGLSQSTISIEITNRRLFIIDKKIKKHISYENIERMHSQDEQDYGYNGQWMRSQERECFKKNCK